MTTSARWSLSLIMAGALSGCFTGVESTPKIDSSDLRKQNVVTTQEQRYLDDVNPQKLNDWQAGKQLLVTDSKIAMLLGPEAQNGSELQGKPLTYIGCEDVTSLTGEPVAQLKFTTPDGLTVSYRMDASVAEVSKRNAVEIPLTIELSVVDEVKRKMMGKSYYLVTRDRYDLNNEAITGNKFIKATVTDVLPGSSFYPVLLEMKDEDGKDFHLYMSVGHDLKAPRNFASLFSLSNPRDRYPNIKDDVWQLIIKGKVKEDMTREECRLSLGSPDNIDRRAGYSVLREVWSYENGKYLIFEDGLLRSYRQ